MANAMYDPTKEAILTGSFPDLSADDVRATLVDLADYTFSSAHSFYDDITVAGRVAEMSTGMTGKTTTNGAFDAADVTWPAVSGDQSEAIVVYDHTGASDAARRLLIFMDTGITGMPVTPSGADITVQWNGSGIFTF